eukprot:127351_1
MYLSLVTMVMSIESFQYNIINNALEWQQSTVGTSLLSDTYGAFIGHNEAGSIFILKGKSLFEFNSITQSYIDHNSSISFGFQQTQTFIQIDSILYMLKEYGTIVTAFNLNTLQFEETTFNPYPGDSQFAQCMTAYGQYLLLIGGRDMSTGSFAKDTFILDTVNNIWSQGVRLPYRVGYHACNTIEHTIYVIGGYNGQG